MTGLNGGKVGRYLSGCPRRAGCCIQLCNALHVCHAPSIVHVDRTLWKDLVLSVACGFSHGCVGMSRRKRDRYYSHLTAAAVSETLYMHKRTEKEKKRITHQWETHLTLHVGF